MALNLEACRTCLKTSRKNFNLYSDIGDDKLISEVLMEEIPIKLHKDDGLPVNICDTCLKKLNQIRDFKTMVIESDTKLHELNKNVEKEILEDNSVTNVDSIKVEICEEEVDPLSHTNDTEMPIFIEVPVEKIIENSASVSGVQNCLPAKDKEEWPHVDDVEIKDEYTKEAEESEEVEKIEIISKIGNEELSNSEMEDNDLASLEDQSSELNISKEENPNDTITSGGRKIYCTLCKRSFAYSYYVQVHRKEHIGKNPHKCDICDKSFVLISSLTEHKKIHTEGKTHLCSICGKSFNRLNNAKMHERNHTTAKTHQCPICSNMFKTHLRLKEHTKRHIGIKSEVCEICGKSFITKSDLACHKVSHNEKAFPCATCGAFFKSQKKVNGHTARVHLKVRKYNCTYCEKIFNSSQNLKNHVRIHTGDKPYSCKICGKSFRQDTTLSQHMPVHTGETRYACTQCPEKFKYRYMLTKHKKVHENE